jgi:hypothetical protein
MGAVTVNGSAYTNPEPGALESTDWDTQLHALLDALVGVADKDDSKIIYVQKNGSDSATGISYGKAKLTISAAITAATSGTKAVVVLDSGNYSEAVTLVNNVPVFAPNATITGNLAATNGKIVLGTLVGNYTQASGTASLRISVVTGNMSNSVGATTNLWADSISGTQTWQGTINKVVADEGGAALDADAVVVDASAFAGNLSATDTDVQTALGTIDGLSIPTTAADVGAIAAPGSPAQGQILYYNGSAWTNLAVGTSGDVLTTQGAGANPIWSTPSSGGGDFIIDYPAGSFDYPASNPAPLNTRSVTNGTVKEQLFDASTEEFVLCQFRLPADISSFVNVYYEAIVSAVTAAGSKYIALKFYESHAGATEDIDVAYTTLTSADVAITNTQDAINAVSKTETIANLGWAANDIVRLKVSRVAPSGANLVGDLGLIHFRVRLSAS